MKYYISDLHFGHKNIIDLSRRPFRNKEEMDETIIKKWNEKVTKQDEVYILGDFSWYTDTVKNVELLNKLNGWKYFIKGNHDEWLNETTSQYLVWVKDYAEIKDNGVKCILCHYPMEDWNGKWRNSIHLFGHIHNNNCIRTDISNRYNVGVDVNEFYPITLEELRNKRI